MFASLIFTRIFIGQGAKGELRGKMEEILYETGFSLCIRSNYISNYNSTNMCEVSKVICLVWLQRKHQKNFIKRLVLVLPILHLVDSWQNCRRPKPSQNILKTSNRALLNIAEQLYGRNITPDTNLPRVVWSFRMSFHKHKRDTNTSAGYTS